MEGDLSDVSPLGWYVSRCAAEGDLYHSEILKKMKNLKKWRNGKNEREKMEEI
jgi:hypothetical protein